MLLSAYIQNEAFWYHCFYIYCLALSHASACPVTRKSRYVIGITVVVSTQFCMSCSLRTFASVHGFARRQESSSLFQKRKRTTRFPCTNDQEIKVSLRCSTT